MWMPVFERENSMTNISYTVRQACQVTGLGKSTIYELVREGRLERIKVGRRALITDRSLRRLIEGTEAA